MDIVWNSFSGKIQNWTLSAFFWDFLGFFSDWRRCNEGILHCLLLVLKTFELLLLTGTKRFSFLGDLRQKRFVPDAFISWCRKPILGHGVSLGTNAIGKGENLSLDEAEGNCCIEILRCMREDTFYFGILLLIFSNEGCVAKDSKVWLSDTISARMCFENRSSFVGFWVLNSGYCLVSPTSRRASITSVKQVFLLEKKRKSSKSWSKPFSTKCIHHSIQMKRSFLEVAFLAVLVQMKV